MIYDIKKPFPTTAQFEGRSYELSLSFDRVLSFFDLWNKDKELSDADKLEIGFSWLVDDNRRISIPKKLRLVEHILCTYILINKKRIGSDKQLLSFSEDSSYIYASFMKEYGIDLFCEQGRLHWWKFNALFSGLSADSIIKQIMAIRAREIPAITSANHKEVMNLIEQKQFYALSETQEQAEQRVERHLDKLFSILKSQAE